VAKKILFFVFKYIVYFGQVLLCALGTVLGISTLVNQGFDDISSLISLILMIAFIAVLGIALTYLFARITIECFKDNIHDLRMEFKWLKERKNEEKK
jgi:ABC-type dipeptide/oligopeptide/nickel transport system permease component